MAQPQQQQYSDLPPGAVVLGATPPPAYSDLPPGAQVLGPSGSSTPSPSATPSTPTAPVAPGIAAGAPPFDANANLYGNQEHNLSPVVKPQAKLPGTVPDMSKVPGAVPGTPSPTQIPKPTVAMQPEASHPLTAEERASGKFAPAPGTELEHVGQMVPQAAVPALQAVQTHVNEPLNRMAQAGAEVGKGIGEEAVSGATILAHPGEALSAALPSPYGPKPRAETPRETARREHPIATGIAGGIGEAAGGAVADPRNWPFYASGGAEPILQKIISLGFSGMMAKDATDAAVDLHANWEKYTPQQRAEIAAKGGISGVMAALGAYHAATEKLPPLSPLRPEPESVGALHNEAREIVNSAGLEYPYNPTAEDLKHNLQKFKARAANAPFEQQPAMKAQLERLSDIYDKLRKTAPTDQAAATPKYSDIPKDAKLLSAPEAKPVHHATNNVEDLRASAERQSEKIGDTVAKATEGVPGAKVEAVRDSKDTERIEDKAERQGVQPSQVGDVLAAKVTVPDQEAANKVLGNIHPQMPVESAEGAVTGEPGKNAVRQTQAIVDTQAPAGEPVKKAEVMLQTPEMAKATEQTHDDYRKAQELRAAGKESEGAELEQKIAREHEAAEQAARQRQEGANAVQKPSTGGVLQRPQEEAREAGSERGRVEPGKQGQEVAAKGAEEGLAANLKHQAVEVYDPELKSWRPASVLADVVSGGNNGARRLRGVFTDELGGKFDNKKIQDVRKPGYENVDKLREKLTSPAATAAKAPQKPYEKLDELRRKLTTPAAIQAKQRPDVGVDFDGTLFKKTEDGSIGEPIPERVASVKKMLDEGKSVAIESDRASRPDKVPKMQAALESVGLGNLPIGHQKTGAARLFDDEKQAGATEQQVATNKNTPLETTPTGRQLTPAEKAMQAQTGTGGISPTLASWQPPPELGAFPDRDVGKKARAAVDKETGPLKRGEERRKIDRTGQQEEDRLFGQARRELGEDATTDQVMARVEELRPKGVPREGKAAEAGSAMEKGAAPKETAVAETRTAGSAATEEAPKYKFGNTQAPIPAHSEAAQALKTARDRISDSDLAGKGKETDPHVTVRYGIKGEDTAAIRKFLSQQAPFEASLGKTQKFPPSEHSDDAAVIIAPIEAPELHRLNDELQKHGDFAPSSFPEYKPHATIAYVDPAKADRYVGMSITNGKTFTVDKVYITDREGNAEPVKLEGRKPGQAPVPPKREPLGDLVIKPIFGGPTKTLKAETIKAGGAASLADAVYEKLKSGESLGNVTELNKLAEEHFGASRASGLWTPKDAFDAMEAGVNKYLLDHGKALLGQDVGNALDFLRATMAKITSQGVRTEEQIKNQQFSTPPTESFIAAKVANLKPSDVVLEPSAGNGGLAVWPKAIGAEVHVNEIAPRRQEMLKEVGFPKPTAHDGELINSLLDPKVKPTVVLMNPPFSASTQKSYEAANRNQYGFNHVDQALQRLEKGGRLVAILGGGQANEPNGGASLTRGASGEWFDKIAGRYQVQANVRISGKEYQKYGTAFATRIIVIDKPAQNAFPSGAVKDWRQHVVQGNFDTLEEAYNALRDVASSRPEIQSGKLAQAEPRRDLEPSTEPRVPSVRQGTGRGGEAHGEVPAAVSGRAEPESRPTASRPEGGTREPSVPEQKSEPRKPAEVEAPGRPRGSAADDHPERQVARGGIDLEEVEAKNQREEEDEKDSAFVTYKPTLKGATHPGSIVETKAMATVPMPPLTYKPDLPESVIGKGPDYKDAKLSAVQLEAVAIAGMQNEITLPGGYRGSALIGDGTGVGKGREGAAILWDNWRKGRKRLVWMSKSKDLMQDAIRDLEGLGAKDLAKSIKSLGKMDASTAINHEGVLYTTYSLFRSGDKKGNTRAAQIDKWLRGNDGGDGGYMLMDESHNLKNAVVSQGQEASQVGQAVKKFLEKMPALRTVSLSATAATDVMNLGYLDRLGLWGPGTPFPGGFPQFAGEIANGGMSAMEMIARELKSQGKYVSRTLTYKGVKYSEHEHTITPEQKQVYTTAAKAWRSIQKSMENTIEETTGGGARQKALAMSQFYSTQQRFFGLLLSSMKIPTTVKLANEALAEGKSVAITLINTNEAAQNREKNRVAAEEEGAEEPDYDFGPGRLIKDMVMEHYPTQQYKDDVDANGNPIKVPVVDEKGNPVQNPQAVKERDELVAKLEKELHMPANPLDELIDQLGGPTKVAELTGRKQRYDPSTNRLVNRAGEGVSQDKINKAEEHAFQSGKKRIAILSSAADTGISLHADKGAANQQQRFVITHQVGWSADKAMQMNGRFNRSNQSNAPEYALLKTNMGGESRFISSIARRMESLEALSKGQTKTSAGTEAMSKVNFETDEGRAATQAFYGQLLKNVDIPDTDATGRDVLKLLGVLKAQAGGGETVPLKERDNVTRLLNRVLALEPDLQNAVYDYFYNIFDAVVKDAIEKGDLDTGVKRIPGDSFEVKEFRPLASDPTTGAKTFYYPVDAQERLERMPAEKFEDALKKADKQGKHPVVMRTEGGKLLLAQDAKPIVRATGETVEAVHVMKPGQGKPEKVSLASLHRWEPVDKAARQKLERAEGRVSQAKADMEYYKGRLKDEGMQEAYRDMFEQRVEQAKERLAAARKERAEAAGEVEDRGYLSDVKDQWQKEYEAAPSHTTEEHHLIGGAVMKYWNPIREATGSRMDVYSTVDAKTGQRVVGIEIPANQIQKLISRISGGKSTVTTSQIIPDVLQNATTYDLEGGIKISRGRVGKENVVKFTTSNPNIQRVLKDMGVIHEIGIQPIYYLPTDKSKAGTVLDKILKEYPVKEEAAKPENLISGESGTFTPSKLAPANIKKEYAKAVEQFISGGLKIGDKYYDVAKHDEVVAHALHIIDNAPADIRRHADANIKTVTAGLNDDQIRLASMMVDSDARDYLQEQKPAEYQQAINDPKVMDAVKRFEPFWKELTQDRLALGWPIRRNIEVKEQADGFHVVDRDGADVLDANGKPELFKTEKAAQKFVEKNGTPEPHLKRIYPEHTKNPLPAEVGPGEGGSGAPHEKGLRPPKMDKKAREASAEYFYQHGTKDFSGYAKSYQQTKFAVAKQALYDDFTNNATKWVEGTAMPPTIEYNGKTYTRPDLVQKAKEGGKKLDAYATYDPSRGEKVIIANPVEGWSVRSTGKPGIAANDRWLGPKQVVDAMENYDATRGGDAGKIRKFFQEQIVGLFGPAVHVNNILRRVGQTAGLGTFDPRSWPSIAKVILSPKLRGEVLSGVNNATIAMLSREGAWVDWNDIGNQNAYIGGNLNPANWVRAFGKGILFDPKFLGGWGGLDPKARKVVADYFKEHHPEMSDQQIAAAVNDGLGNYNRANWTARQRMLAKFTLFPGWDTGSVKWFLRKPFVGFAGAIAILAINQALKALGKNKDEDSDDLHYVHIGERKFSTGLLSDNMGEHIMAPVLGALQAQLQGEDVAAGATEGLMRGSSALAGTLAGPIVEMVADQVYNKKYAGGAQEIVKDEDRYTPGTWAPNVELEKRIAFAALKGSPALNRFIDNKGHWDWAQGLGGAMLGVTNYKYGAEERFKANVAKAAEYGKIVKQLAENNPEAAADYVKDPARATYLMFHDDLQSMAHDLKEIDGAIEQVRGSDLPADERQKALNDLKDNRNQLLKAADGLNDALQERKSQARKEQMSFWQRATGQAGSSTQPTPEQ